MYTAMTSFYHLEVETQKTLQAKRVEAPGAQKLALNLWLRDRPVPWAVEEGVEKSLCGWGGKFLSCLVDGFVVCLWLCRAWSRDFWGEFLRLALENFGSQEQRMKDVCFFPDLSGTVCNVQHFLISATLCRMIMLKMHFLKTIF